MHLVKKLKQAAPQNREKKYVSSSKFLFSPIEANVAITITYLCMQASSHALESTGERRVLRSSAPKDHDNADPAGEPSRGIVNYSDFRI
jgi:hypothetical protein